MTSGCKSQDTTQPKLRRTPARNFPGQVSGCYSGVILVFHSKTVLGVSPQSFLFLCFPFLSSLNTRLHPLKTPSIASPTWGTLYPYRPASSPAPSYQFTITPSSLGLLIDAGIPLRKRSACYIAEQCQQIVVVDGVRTGEFVDASLARVPLLLGMSTIDVRVLVDDSHEAAHV